jgi:hypothetical protein
VIHYPLIISNENGFSPVGEAVSDDALGSGNNDAALVSRPLQGIDSCADDAERFS